MPDEHMSSIHDDPPPIACTLGPAALADRAGAWRDVIALGLRERAAADDGVRLVFDAAVAPAVRELVALEAECCAWFETRVTQTPDAVHVHLQAATADGAELLRAMFATG